MATTTIDIEVILFDLGGVLIELGESPFHHDWVDPDNQQASNDWHLSPANVAFDKGMISAETFAQTFKSDLKLSASPQQIGNHFRDWPIGPYAGVHQLLQSLRSQFRLAILTNTNALDWPRIVDEFNITSSTHGTTVKIAMLRPITSDVGKRQ